jgi:HEPN domain-containing protein
VPKIHNIPFILAKIETSLSLTIKPEIYDLLDTLSSHYLNNRYPDFTAPPNIHIDKNKATDLLEKTKEAFTWLLTLKK